MCVFSKLSLLTLDKKGAERSWGRAAELGRIAALGHRVLLAVCCLVQVSTELFFLALTQPSLCSTQMFPQQLHGYHVIPRASRSPSAFQEDSLLMKANARSSMRCWALANILSQLVWLLSCHCLVQWCFTLLQISSKQTLGKIL